MRRTSVFYLISSSRQEYFRRILPDSRRREEKRGEKAENVSHYIEDIII